MSTTMKDLIEVLIWKLPMKLLQILC